MPVVAVGGDVTFIINESLKKKINVSNIFIIIIKGNIIILNEFNVTIVRLLLIKLNKRLKYQ